MRRHERTSERSERRAWEEKERCEGRSPRLWPRETRATRETRESAEERGLAAAARLAAAVSAATQADPKFRLRRHSALGCSPFLAWKDPKEEKKDLREDPKDQKNQKEKEERRSPPPPRESSPPRPRLTRAQSARRPARLDVPGRARSADPRRRYEAAFVPEGTEEWKEELNWLKISDKQNRMECLSEVFFWFICGLFTWFLAVRVIAIC